MARKFLTPIDLNKLELKNAKIQNLGTPPGSPTEGQVYYDTNDHVLKTWNGTAWINASQGTQGTQGLQGEIGTQGTTGTQGSTGTQGADGYVGSDGAQGTTGSQGIQGEQGIQGWDGTQGIQGETGAQGVQGETGSQGVQGEQGTQGIQGVQGETGAQGVQGEQGVQGTQGEQGIQGTQGETGTQGAEGSFGGVTVEYLMDTTSYTMSDPGSGYVRLNGGLAGAGYLAIDNNDINATDISSYLQTIDDSTSTIKGHVKISLKNNPAVFALYAINSMVDQTGWFQLNITNLGYAGTITDESDVLVTFARTGDVGAQGTQGIQGETGTQGAEGAQGTTGAQGVQGETGTQGVQGETGSQGAQGVQGEQGTQGVQGEQGTQGTQGLQGFDGTQGIQGISGQLGTYAATITPSSPYSTTSFTITHNLGTTDVQVVVYDTFSGANPQEVVTDVFATGSNTVSVVFAVAPASGETYRVVVRG